MRIEIHGRDEDEVVEFFFNLDWPSVARLPVAGEVIKFDIPGPDVRFRVTEVHHWFGDAGYSVTMSCTLMSHHEDLETYRSCIDGIPAISDFQFDYF